MRVGIVGAGSIGTLFAFALAGAAEVRLLGRPGSSRRTARLEGTSRTIAIDDDPARLATCGLIVVAVKAYDTIAALAPLRGVATRDATIVSLQNGPVACEHIDAALGDRMALVFAPTTEGAMHGADGAVRRAGSGITTIGWAAGRRGSSEVLAFLRNALANAGFTTRVARSIEPALWMKAIVNAAVNPTTALAGVPNGALAADHALYRRARLLASEAAAVAYASGIALGADPLAVLDATIAATASNRSSMLQDLDAGRPTEVDAITGAIVSAGIRAGVAVPENARALDEVRARAKA